MSYYGRSSCVRNFTSGTDEQMWRAFEQVVSYLNSGRLPAPEWRTGGEERPWWVGVELPQLSPSGAELVPGQTGCGKLNCGPSVSAKVMASYSCLHISQIPLYRPPDTGVLWELVWLRTHLNTLYKYTCSYSNTYSVYTLCNYASKLYTKPEIQMHTHIVKHTPMDLHKETHSSCNQIIIWKCTDKHSHTKI